MRTKTAMVSEDQAAEMQRSVESYAMCEHPVGLTRVFAFRLIVSSGSIHCVCLTGLH